MRFRLKRLICCLVSVCVLLGMSAVPTSSSGSSISREITVKYPKHRIVGDFLEASTSENALEKISRGIQDVTETVISSCQEPAESVSEDVIEDKDFVSIDEVPLYFQTDYPNVMYGSGTIKTSGCSITCLAMVASYLTNHTYSPAELAGYFGGKAENNIARLEYGAEKLGLPYETGYNCHEAINALREGKVVIALMNSKSTFTDSQHFVVLTGITEDGNILVNDPYEPNYERWDLKDRFVTGFNSLTISNGYSGGWVFDKNQMPEEPFIYEEVKTYVEPRYSSLDLSIEDIDLLAKVVWGEARGESLEGQQAVAEVILNRMMSENFQNTITGIVFAENQFESIGLIDEAEPNQTQYEAINNAIYGPYILPTDVVYFATHALNDNIWGEVGNHVFCYPESN